MGQSSFCEGWWNFKGMKHKAAAKRNGEKSWGASFTFVVCGNFNFKRCLLFWLWEGSEVDEEE